MFAVNLFLAGFNKSGSSTMSVVLKGHPAVLLPEPTEPWHFVLPDYEERWDAHRGCFQDWQSHEIICDDSVAYSSRPAGRPGMETAVNRIRRHNPEAKFLFIARDPVARIESAFRELHDTGVRFGVHTPFDLAAAMEQLPHLVDDSCYWECLEVFRAAFGRERLHMIHLEDLIAEPEATMAGVWRFIGVDGREAPTQPLPRANEGSTKQRDSWALRRLRVSPRVGPRLARVPIDTQNRWLSKVGLRRRFRGEVRWTEPARTMVVERVWPDAQLLWRDYGAPAGGWPRLQGMAESSRSRSAR